jgi:hypothetical protein
LPDEVIKTLIKRATALRLQGYPASLFFQTRGGRKMKKLLTATLALATLGIVGAGSATTANAKPQIRIQLGQRHRDRDYNRRYRDRDYRDTQNVIQTRIVRDGWRTYRETYQLRYLPDGRVQTVLIARERVN